MEGFFSESEFSSRQPLSLVPSCGKCGLHKTCQSPKMPVAGKGKKKILVVGEAPGKNEDTQNLPFVGDSGQLLQRTFDDLGYNLFRDCWVTNSLICRPPKNAAPTSQQIEYCRPNLFNLINDLEPVVVILLGTPAVQSLIGHLWRSDPGGIFRWAGFQIPCREHNCWVCPTYHPRFVLGSEKNPVVDILFRDHLRSALRKKKRPWDVIEDPRDYVTIYADPEEAVDHIDEFSRSEIPVAFDYENDCLKPDRDDAEIVCCALSDGVRSIAYPWLGNAVNATRKFLRSKTPKVASNLQHEERWTIKKLGAPVKNWHHDTMLTAHILDNRQGASGLKFQAFVNLGVAGYDDHISGFLKSKDSNTKNRIREVDIESILLYCGLDALLTILVYQKQQKQINKQRT